MAEPGLSGVYSDGDAYENFMGRWSRASGRKFVTWLDLPEGLRWLDVGCGTGAFTEVILERGAPGAVTAIDPHDTQIRYARSHIADPRAAFEVGDGLALPVDDQVFDVAAAALVLNFVADADALISEMARAVRPGGTVGAYVWDFEGGGNVSQHIWESVAATDPDAPIFAGNAERIRLGRPETLTGIFEGAGLRNVATKPIDITVTYRDVAAYWDSNDTTTNPIGRYIRSLSQEGYRELKNQVEQRIPTDEKGSVQYAARAHAVRGVLPR